MKRRIIAIVIVLASIAGTVFAGSDSLLWFSTEADWFAVQSAEETVIPEGLTEREAEIYRAGFANGHYNALNPEYVEGLYVLNRKTRKYHLSNCMNTLIIETVNREHSTLTPIELESMGYKPCGNCHPDRKQDEPRAEGSGGNGNERAD